MDDTEQYPPCNEETAYHETGHAVVGVVLGRPIQMIRCNGEEGCANFGLSPNLSPRDLLTCNVAGYVAEELRQHELKDYSFNEIPSLESSELISARIEANRWAGINDAVEAVDNARKALNAVYDPTSASTGMSDAETISVLEEIRMGERRAARILFRRWEAVRKIAAELHQFSLVVGRVIREAIGAERLKRPLDE